MELCLDLADGICVTWDDTIQFWELIATVFFTSLVTGLTVWISVREARRATGKQLAADARLRADERADAERDRRLAEGRGVLDLIRNAIWWGNAGYQLGGETYVANIPAHNAVIGMLRVSTTPNGPLMAEWLVGEFEFAYSNPPPAVPLPVPDLRANDRRAIRLAAPEYFSEVVTQWIDDPTSVGERLRHDLADHGTYGSPTETPQP